MFEGSLHLLVKDHERELQDAARRDRPGRQWMRQSDERRQRRADAARRILSGTNRRG
jgi:hypothetical protein